MARDILDQLRDEALLALSFAGREWPSGLLSRTVIPDKWIGLVESADGRRRFVPAGDAPRAEDGDRITLVRNRPLVVPLETRDCRSEDGDVVHGRCAVFLRWPSEEHELAALRKTLLPGGRLNSDDLARHVADRGGVQGLRDFIARQQAGPLVRSDVTEALTEAMRAALQKFCFESGARIERVAEVAFESTTLDTRERLERQTQRRLAEIRAREMVEQAAAQATQRRLGELSGVLDKLNDAASSDAEGNWHELLPALSPTERGELLANLWRITPDQQSTERIAVVAGQMCLLLDPSDPRRPLREVELPGDLGRLRSVAYAAERDRLLIGAAEGIWSLSADAQGVPQPYPVPDIERQGTGFNAVAALADAYYATHSALGCWRWAIDDPRNAAQIFAAGGEVGRVRAAIAAGDGRLLFSADRTLHAYDPEADEVAALGEMPGTIAAISVLDGVAYVGTSDGALLELRLEAGAVPRTLQQLHSGVESIVARRWNDLVELVVPAGREGVQGVYGSERITATVLASREPIRRAWACDDVVVALNDRRDALVISYPRKSPTPVTVPLARQVGHSLQDACLISKPVSA